MKSSSGSLQRSKASVGGAASPDRHAMIAEGILLREGGRAFILDAGGGRLLEGVRIWDGYLRHFLGRRVRARLLPQRDYETGEPILIIWPVNERGHLSYTELYYNERLVKYPASTLGHIALNVNGSIFNFSHLLNENEIISEEEYFYRPALGEFAPHPLSGRYNTDDPERPYYDKFGRNFMRSIHVLRIEGLDTGRLLALLEEELQRIHETPVDPRRPEKYRDFNLFTRSCTTIIRDCLRASGFPAIRGIFPRDLFVSAAYYFLRNHRGRPLRAGLYRMPQFLVPEAQESAMTPLLNPLNRLRWRAISALEA